MWRWTGSAAGSRPSTAPGSSRATSSHRMRGPPTLFVQHVAQLLAAPVEADLGGRDGDAELVGDVLVREAVDVLQDHDGPQLRGQLVEGLGQLGETRGRLGLQVGLGVEAGVGRLVDLVERRGPEATA